MRLYIPLLVTMMLVACQKPVGQDGRPVILTKNDQLARHIGEIVTVQGLVSSSRVPQIIGVDVSLEDPLMAGAYAEATGVLYSWRVTAESHAAMLVMGDMVAVRGPGTYFSLVNPAYLAPVRSFNESPVGPLGSVPPDGMDQMESGIEIDVRRIEGTFPEDLPVD